jgi:O-antigen ligase
MTRDERWTAIFDRIALFLTLLGFLLRESIPSTTAGAGLNLFIHLLFWVALTLWFAGRATTGGAVYKFSGFEFAFLAFSVVALVSVQRASFRPAALDQALTWLSYALFFVLCVQVVGRRLLLSALIATAFTMTLDALIQKAILFPKIQSVAATSSVEMARRILTNEPFATLGGPNQLAGFLVLLLPVIAGSMLDARDFKGRGAALALGLLALCFTESKGGGVAIVCGTLSMLALYKTRAGHRRAAVGVGVGLTALAVALVLWSPLLSALSKHSHSMHVRAVYWRATGPIIAQSPALGVGLDNWQDHYYQTKSEVQQETDKTHDDYLQILAETGIIGFLAFAGILILGLRKSLSRESAPEPPAPDPSPWFVAAVAAVVILVGVLHAGDYSETARAFVLGTAWVGAWAYLRRLPEPTDLTWTRLGLAGGLIAFMVHMTVDFQLSVYGVLAAFVAVLALIAAHRGGMTPVQLPKAVCGIATVFLLATTAPLLMAITPRAMAADNELEEAQAALASFQSGTSGNPTLDLSNAIRLSEASQAHNPVNPEAYRLFASAKYREWLLLRDFPGRDPRMIEEAEGMVLQALENAVKLRPLLSPLHDELAQAHRGFRRYYLKQGKNSEMASVKAAEHLRQAIEQQRRAYELYPTSARNAYSLGRLLEVSKDAEAPRYYEEALRLSEKAGQELEDLDRLKIGPIARARCLRALGKPLEAHDILDQFLRKLIAGLPAQDAHDRLQRFVKSSDDEMEEGMTPVLKDVVDAIMRDLK